MKLAVVIPTYNRKKYIKECIDSFLPIFKLNAEVKLFIVDDGSTDGTFEYVKLEYTTEINNKNIHIIQQLNSERAVARNAGAQLALNHFMPDYFLFFDADDVISTGEFIDAISLIQENKKYDLYSFRFQIWIDKDNSLSKIYPLRSSVEISFENFVNESSLPLGCTFVSASCFKKLEGFHPDRKLSGSEDWFFFLRAIYQFKAIGFQNIITLYRQHDQNTSIQNFENSMKLLKTLCNKELEKTSYFSLVDAQIDYFLAGAYNRENLNVKKYFVLFNIAKNHTTEIFKIKFLRTLLSFLYHDLKSTLSIDSYQKDI